MTGERFRLSEVPFQDGPYQRESILPHRVRTPIRAVILTDGSFARPYVTKPLGDPNAMLTPAEAFLVSIDMCDVGSAGFTYRAEGDLFQILVGAGTLTVLGQSSNSFIHRVEAVYPYTRIEEGLANFLISADAESETIQAYRNDVLLTPSLLLWNTTGRFHMQGSHHEATMAAVDSQDVRVVRVWAGTPLGLLDLTDVANRRMFVTAAGRPASIPAEGYIDDFPPPNDFLYAPTVANEFAHNWAGLLPWDIVNGPLAFDMAACFIPGT